MDTEKLTVFFDSFGFIAVLFVICIFLYMIMGARALLIFLSVILLSQITLNWHLLENRVRRLLIR